MSARVLNTLLPQEAYVVFTGRTDLPWLRWLKPGFRHCFVLLNDGRQWAEPRPALQPYGSAGL
ncbi:MAG: hypothetical protein LRZ85_00855 [Alphaproteobacteria bacterium]|nr:hypothetical protein [Alphaproteobacteria bacterium]